MTTDDRAALAARHRPSGIRAVSVNDRVGARFCLNCDQIWPCDTARALALLDDERRRVEAILSEEPHFEPPASEGVARWYSEGWNRCARDIRVALAGPSDDH